MIVALVTLGVAAFLVGLALMVHRAGSQGRPHRVVETVTVTRTVEASSVAALHAALNRAPQPLPTVARDGVYQITDGS